MSELLSTVVKLACERLDLLVNDFVRANVTTLRKGFAANVATIRALSCVSSLMCLQSLVHVDKWEEVYLP